MKAVTDASFSRDVLDSDKVVLVDFWAEWCAPCHRLSPIVEEIADERAGELEVFKLDAEAETGVVMRHDVRAMPTLLLFSGGEEIGRIVGALPKSRIVATLDEALAASSAA